MTQSCFVIGLVDGDGVIAKAFMCSESPTKMTRAWCNGVAASEMVVICEGRGESFAEAEDSARDLYERLFPVLSKRLAWEGFSS